MSELFAMTKHGYIYKQSKIVGLFKKRFIVIDNNTLFSYKSEEIFKRNKQKYTEIFDLSIYSRVEITVNKYYIKKFEFALYSSTTHRRFRCDSAFELQSWVNNIRDVHRHIKKNHLTLHFAGIRSPKYSINTLKLVDAASITTIQSSLTVKDTVRSLKNILQTTYGIPHDKEMLILYAHTIISAHEELTLQQFHITNNSLLLLIISADNNPHKSYIEYLFDIESSPSLEQGPQHPIIRSLPSLERGPRHPITRVSMSNTPSPIPRNRSYWNLSQLNASSTLYPETLRNTAFGRAAMPMMIMSDSNYSLRTLSNVDNDNAMECRNGFDVIMQEDNVSVYRMPGCGHWMNRESLYQYALNTVRDRNSICVKCPHPMDDEKKDGFWSCHRCTFHNPFRIRRCSMCGTSKPDHSTLCDTKWDYIQLKKILTANRSKTEVDCNHKLATLELYIARNMVEKECNIQKCSECETFYYKENDDDERLGQIISKTDLGEKFKTRCVLCADNEFCWGCGAKWNYAHFCDSSFRLELVDILSSADTKRIGDVGDVPSIRCCPNCCQLIKHSEACKHMKCDSCRADFCFICLKQKKNGYWPCGQHSDICPVAPRQNIDTLPINKKAFKLF